MGSYAQECVFSGASAISLILHSDSGHFSVSIETQTLRGR